MKEAISIKVFVASLSGENRDIIDGLQHEIRKDRNHEYTLEIVNVLEMPEKAVEANVFSTPAILRDMPQPIILLIGRLAKAHDVLTIVQSDHNHHDGIVVV